MAQRRATQDPQSLAHRGLVRWGQCRGAGPCPAGDEPTGQGASGEGSRTRAQQVAPGQTHEGRGRVIQHWSHTTLESSANLSAALCAV